MKKRVMTSIMAIVLAISLTVPAFATTYTDLTNHWAKTYMEALASGGYMNGYTDGTMKPDRNMTTCETLTLLSRLYSLNDLQSEMVTSDYGAIAKANMPTTVSWAYGYIEVCLAAGIITESELKSTDLTANIKKEQLAVFLVRAVQLTSAAENLKDSALTFADASTISSTCVGSVAELVTLGIVKGDTANNFSPKTNVTRAVVATMVARTLDYLETKGTTLAIAAYNGLVQQTGIIKTVSGSTVEICGYDSMIREYTLSASSKTFVNSTAGTLSSTYVGCAVTVTAKNNTVVNLSITNDSTVKWVQGIYTSISSISSGITLSIKSMQTDVVMNYTVPTASKVTQDGTTAAITAIKTGSFVSIKTVSNVVTEVRAITGDRTLSGTVSLISYGTTVTLKITDSNSAVYTFPLKITSLPTVKRGNTAISFDRLKIGNKVTLTIDDCDAKTIVIEGAESSVTGVLKSITTLSSGTTWVITNTSGTDTSYTLDEDAAAYSGTTEIAISGIQVGDTVSVVAYSGVITEIHRQTTVNAATKVSGTTLKVDTSSGLVTILTETDKLIYVSTSNVVSIISGTSGGALYLSSIATGSEIVAYGAYTDSRNFKAKSIVVE